MEFLFQEDLFPVHSQTLLRTNKRTQTLTKSHTLDECNNLLHSPVLLVLRSVLKYTFVWATNKGEGREEE